ncbi:MAG TPA: lysylphosphatidylglycerol synthase transmembrane domain-containing protein [Williamwhitmania sp.]|nr:lysylphosphatidylglycerol synthase transmembrane domain-containing protein [Williamwhitmania sp.]
MEATAKVNPLSKIKASRIIYPIIIGLAVVGYMLWDEFNPNAFRQIKLGWEAGAFLGLAALFMVTRDLGYIIRLRILSDNRLSFLHALRVVILWEFTSAITPSAIGGTSIAILYVHKEGLTIGQSSAVVMATSLLDELYFIVMFPILLILVGSADLFDIPGANAHMANDLLAVAWTGYGVKLAYLVLLSYGMFVNPRGLKWLLMKVFKLPFLRRWKHGANQAGTDIIKSSRELRKKHIIYWLKAGLATFVSWTARYWVVNALLLAFFVVHDHLLIFARQLVMWIMMLVSPTPGGSGFAEYIFTVLLGEFIPVNPDVKHSTVVALSFIWRLFSYYPYLFIGVFVFPRWIKRKFGKAKL